MDKESLLSRFRWIKSSFRWLRWINPPFRWLRRIYRRIRWWYWHYADTWPLLALRRFGKALFVLVLWALTAIGIFYLLKFLPLEILYAGEETGRLSKESVAILGSLLTALIGFGLQQWKGQEEEERRRQEEENRALSLIEEDFCDLLRRDLSEAARRYADLRRKGGVWQSNKVRARLEEVWEKEAPLELRCAVSTIEQLPERREFDRSKQIDAFRWAYDHLDEDWQSRAATALIGLGEAVPEWTDKAWFAILGIWPEVTLGKGLISIPDRCILLGLHYLGLGINPFGSEKAEMDLPKAWVTPTWWKELASLSGGLFFTVPGGGRTAAAILLTYDALLNRTAFPVYCRVATARLDLEDLARWTAQAIARYISLFPASFTECPPGTKAAIKRLLSGYLSTDPLLYLQQAGLPSVREGRKVAEEFRAYLPGPPSLPLSQPDLLILLSQARPAVFPRTLILVDVQRGLETKSVLPYFYALSDLLARAGVILQVFLAVSPSDNPPMYGKFLEWSDDDLHDLLRRRLSLFSSDETLDTWCDLRVWKSPSAEERLVAAAAHNPRRLIRLGNALLRRIGERALRLQPEDVDEVLAQVR